VAELLDGALAQVTTHPAGQRALIDQHPATLRARLAGTGLPVDPGTVAAFAAGVAELDDQAARASGVVGALSDRDQRRHLHAAHHLSDSDADLALLARTERRPVAYADAHEWWHVRQRRSLSIGGGLADQGRDR
jgi:hypothetical protein